MRLVLPLPGNLQETAARVLTQLQTCCKLIDIFFVRALEYSNEQSVAAIRRRAEQHVTVASY